MRVVIDAATPVVKKFGEQVLNKGINMASDKVVAKIPGVTKKAVKGVKTVAEMAKETSRELRARRGVKTIDAPEVEVKSSDE